MKILAVDTTSDRVSLAVGDNAACVKRSVAAPGAHDEKLFSEAQRLLKKAGLSLKDIGVFAVASGPGSFTGIRVGMTFVSVLAQSQAKPAVAVSLFEAEAARAWPAVQKLGARGMAVVLPAVCDELYFQAFISRNGFLEPFSEARWVSPDAWPNIFYDESAGRKMALVGSAAHDAARRLKSGKPAAMIWQGPPLTAAGLIGPALKKLAFKSHELIPLYLKPAYYERSASPVSR